MKKQYYLFFTILAFYYSCKNENPSVTTFYPDGSKREVYKTKKDKMEGEYLQYYNTGYTVNTGDVFFKRFRR